MNLKLYTAFAVIAASLMTSGCAPKLGGSDYSVAGVGEISQTEEGIVVAKRVVQLNASDPSKPGVGAGAGMATGAILGSAAGGSPRGSLVAGAAGGLIGAFAGHAIEQQATHQEGFEYQIRMIKTGEVITVAQGAEPNLGVGQPVYVVKSNRSRSRVIPR